MFSYIVSLFLIIFTVVQGQEIQDEIVNGQRAEKGDFPCMVNILKGLAFQPSCGGSIIGDEWILTAGHCLFDENGVEDHDGLLAGLIGELGLFRGTQYLVKERFIFPGYNDPFGATPDIALFKVNPIQFELGRIEKCYLPPKNYDLDKDTDNMTCAVAGWGETMGVGPSDEYLNWSIEYPRKSEFCKKEFPGYKIHPFHLCTMNEHQESCSGDSGGPLFCFRDTQKLPRPMNHIFGLLSYGSPDCGTKGKFPTVWTRLTEPHVFQWIDDTCGGCLRETRDIH